MRKRRLYIPLAIASLLSGWVLAVESGPGRSEPSLGNGLEEIRKEIRQRVAAGELPSLAVGVIRDGELVWKESFGWADREAMIRAETSTPYRLASLGKSITATAVMTLLEAGSIELADPAAPYLAPESLWSPAGYAESVSVRNLLDMTAAIPHGGYTYFQPEDAGAVTPAMLVRQRGLVAFPPGEVATYSNFDYGVLEQLIERVAGVPYGEYLKQALFTPLGMTESSAGNAAASSPPAVRYGSDRTRLEPVHSRPLSSLGLRASLDDLLRYARFHLGEELGPGKPPLGVEALHLMHTEKPPLERTQFALGWGSIDLDGDLWLLTNGRASGVQSTLTLWPAERIAVAVLSNITGNVTDDLAFRILDQFVPGFLDRFEELKAGFEVRSRRPVRADELPRGRWNGRVSSRTAEMPLQLAFAPEGQVKIRLGDQPETRLGDLRWDGDLLVGRLDGKLPIEETADEPYGIDLHLRIREARIEGYAVGRLSNRRGRFSLAALVGLRPAGGQQTAAAD